MSKWDGCVAGVDNRLADLCTDELFHQFICDATEIISAARGEPWWDLMQLTDKALDIEDVEERIATLEYYVTLAERGLHIEGFTVEWIDGYFITKDES